MRKTFLLFALLGLGACAQVEQQVGKDLTSASAIAAAAGDTQLVGCIAALQKLLAAQPSGVQLNLVTKAVVVKEARGLFGSNGACAGVTADVAVEALNKLVPGL